MKMLAEQFVTEVIETDPDILWSHLLPVIFAFTVWLKVRGETLGATPQIIGQNVVILEDALREILGDRIELHLGLVKKICGARVRPSFWTINTLDEYARKQGLTEPLRERI